MTYGDVTAHDAGFERGIVLCRMRLVGFIFEMSVLQLLL